MFKRKTRIVLITFLAAGIAAALVEVSLRIAPELRPSYAQNRIEFLYKIDSEAEPWWVHDDDLGFLERPLRNEQVVTLDFSYTRRTDRFGFPNFEPWPPTADVLFLGDSLLSGVGVGLERQFTTLVAKALPDRTVINLSLPGASPEHLLRLYRRFGVNLEPTIVFAVLYVVSDVDNAKRFDAWNRFGKQWAYEDFRANYYLDAYKKVIGEEPQPPEAISEDGGEPNDKGGIRERVRSAVNASVLGREILYVLEPFRKGVIHSVDWPGNEKVYLYRRFQNRLDDGIGSDYPGVTELFFGPLVELKQSVESDGGKFVIALLPSKEEVFVHADSRNHLRLVNEVKSRLSELGFDVLDLYPAIRELGETAPPYFPHDIHLNTAGNEATAASLSDWIRRNKTFEKSN